MILFFIICFWEKLSSSQILIVSFTNRGMIKASNQSAQPYVYSVSNFYLIPGRGHLLLFPATDRRLRVRRVHHQSHPPWVPQPLLPLRPAESWLTWPLALLGPVNAGAEFVKARANLPLASINLHLLQESVIPYRQDDTDPLSDRVPVCVCKPSNRLWWLRIAWSSNHFLVDANSVNLLTNSCAELIWTNMMSESPEPRPVHLPAPLSTEFQLGRGPQLHYESCKKRHCLRLQQGWAVP